MQAFSVGSKCKDGAIMVGRQQKICIQPIYKLFLPTQQYQNEKKALIYSYTCCFSSGIDTSIMDSEELPMHWQLQRKLTNNIFFEATTIVRCN
jgi:hypothetical protein